MTCEELLESADELVPVTQNRRWLFRKNESIIGNMKKCIKQVRDEVLDELVLFRSANVTSAKKTKRLLYLFSKDLLQGVSGKMLQDKDKRDNMHAKSVPLWAKICGWSFVLLFNTALLFYIMLFALSKSDHSQRAWFLSFVIWLLLEIILVSSAVVFAKHILLPTWIMRDLQKIKERLLADIMDYRDATRRDGGSSSLSSQQLPESTSSFNVADYMFTSNRIAKLYPDLAHSPVILRFRTIWPPASLLAKADVSKGYSRKYAIVMQSLQRVLIFVITGFVQIPTSMQDVFVELMSTSGLGYIVILHLQLFDMHPILAFVPACAIALLFHFYLSSNKYDNRLSLGALVDKYDKQESTLPVTQRLGSRVNKVAPIEVAGTSATVFPEHLISEEVGDIESPRLRKTKIIAPSDIYDYCGFVVPSDDDSEVGVLGEEYKKMDFDDDASDMVDFAYISESSGDEKSA